MKKYSARVSVILLLSSLSVSGCLFKKKSSVDPHWSSNPDADSLAKKKVDISKLEFQYVEKDGLCKNADGKIGFNSGLIHCGLADGIQDKYGDYSSQDLRGLNLKNSWLSSANFDYARLDGAVIAVTDITYASFKNADLRGANLKVAMSNSPLSTSYFSGAKVSRGTRLQTQYENFDLPALVESGIVNYDGASEYELLAFVADPTLVFENKISAIKRRMVLEDRAELSKTSISAECGGIFDTYFNGNTTDAVASFVSERMNFLFLNSSVKDKENTRASNDSSGIYGRKLSATLQENLNTARAYLKLMSTVERYPVEDLGDLEKDLTNYIVKLNGLEFPIKSCTVGSMSLMPAYFKGENIELWVHEAAHSNCFVESRVEFSREFREIRASSKVVLNGIQTLHAFIKNRSWSDLSQDQRQKFNKDHSQIVDQFNEVLNRTASFLKVTETTVWGHAHVDCPSSLPDPGVRGLQDACDAHAFGAYAAGGIFASAASKNCSNCGEKAKQVYKIIATDAFARVLVLDDMLNGYAGKPRRGELHDADWME